MAPLDDADPDRPLISIIIPVFNAGPYLPACLDSITRQDCKDIEIIAIDGGSQDSSGQILDERAEYEPRLTVLHRERIGPGKARNAGISEASGRYLWFVDADDRIADDCLQAIAGRLTDVEPDVLLLNYVTISPAGKIEPNPAHMQISAAGAGVFTISEQPWAITMSLASWNKVVRSEFLDSLGTAFLPDWPHEDVRLSGQLLLAAERLSALSTVCYHYQSRHAGSATMAGDPERHFLIFSSWRPLLEEQKKRFESGDPAISPAVYRAYFDRAIWHYSTILDAPGLIAKADRHRFFTCMHWDFVRYAPASYRETRDLRGLKFRLIASNAYLAYAALVPFNKVRNILRRAVPVPGTLLRRRRGD